jgi:hypothetical protein
MAGFLVERYWPGVTRDTADAATAALRAGGLVVLEMIVAAADEVCLWYVQAPSAAHVTAGFGAASIPFDRLTAATRVAR